MSAKESDRSAWPELRFAEWRDSGATLQLWTQIVGKLRLALSPWLNHGWQVPLYVSARGLGSSAMHVGDGRLVEVEFDLVDHRPGDPLVRRAPSAASRSAPMSVAALLSPLHGRARRARHPRRDQPAAERGGRSDSLPRRRGPRRLRPGGGARHVAGAGAGATACFRHFRSGFLGKASPVHLFWGAFDLAVTRFSGRPAPLHPGGIPGLPDAVTREAYSHEVTQRRLLAGQRCLSAGGVLFLRLSRAGRLRLRAGRAGGRCLVGGDGRMAAALRGGAQRRRPRRRLLIRFLETSYRAAADLGRWDPALECALGEPGQPRQVGAG